MIENILLKILGFIIAILLVISSIPVLIFGAILTLIKYMYDNLKKEDNESDRIV